MTGKGVSPRLPVTTESGRAVAATGWKGRMCLAWWKRQRSEDACIAIFLSGFRAGEDWEV